MKSLFMMALGLTSFTTAFGRDVELQFHNFVDLNVAASEVTVGIGYPGMQGRACGIELRSSRSYGTEEGLGRLAAAIEVKNGFEFAFPTEAKIRTSEQVARYDLDARELNKYVTRIRIRTRNGRSLAEVIRKTVPKSIESDAPVRVIAQLVDCD